MMSGDSFVVCLVRLDENGNEVRVHELTEGNQVFGRGSSFYISDQRVSRKHCSILVDSSTRSITIVPNSQNASYIIRHGSTDSNNQTFLLIPNHPVMCQHNDILSLLEGKIQFLLRVANEYEMADVGEELDATLLNTNQVDTARMAQYQQQHYQATIAATNARGGAFPHSVHGAAAATDAELLDPSEIQEIKVIGSGSCGEVVKAKWRGDFVACKKIFRALVHGDALQEFMSEVKILRKLRHPNIVLFMGMYNKNGETGIITEFMKRGSLFDVLEQEGEQMSVARLVHMAADTARGMNYLHACQPPIIHRDLKSHNLLVGEGYSIKVTDFGLARQFKSGKDRSWACFLTSVGDRAKTFCGTMAWTAPEVFAGGGYTEKADVYSFGVVLWELCARGKAEPYPKLTPPSIIIGVTDGSLRPPPLEGAPVALTTLAARCWALDPAQRPSIGSALLTLTDAEETADAEEARAKARSKKRSRDSNSGSNRHQQPAADSEWAPQNVEDRFRRASQQPADASSSEDVVVQPKRRRKLASATKFQDEDGDDNDADDGVTELPTMSWELDAAEIEFDKELGSGTSAVVYKGTYRGQTVAIKVLKTQAPADEFRQELTIMASLRSPNVVFFYGALLRPQTALVIEYFKNGSLHDVMLGTTTNVLFDWDLVLRLALGATRAIAALHSWKPTIVHRDLKSPNLLVDDSFNVKVADFGLARFTTPDNNQTLTQLRGTYAYLAPESYEGQVFTTKSDVFSLSIIIWELVNRLITGDYMRPYEEHKHLQFDYQIIIQTAKNGLRPVIHASCPPPLCALMENAWNADPNKRPTAVEVLKELESVQQMYEQQKRGQI